MVNIVFYSLGFFSLTKLLIVDLFGSVFSWEDGAVFISSNLSSMGMYLCSISPFISSSSFLIDSQLDLLASCCMHVSGIKI